MNVECPACKSRGKIEGEKVPEEGRRLVCPRCGERFLVRPERTISEIIRHGERMQCPRCGCEQNRTETCAICGVVIQEHIRAAALQRDRERLELSLLHSKVRDVDGWYRGLFDFRLAGLIIRVLFLLAGFGLFMTCSLRSIRPN
jgi:predicted Zn finger-like uncharacterized protein